MEGGVFVMEVGYESWRVGYESWWVGHNYVMVVIGILDSYMNYSFILRILI